MRPGIWQPLELRSIQKPRSLKSYAIERNNILGEKKSPSLAIRELSLTGTQVEIEVKHNSGLFWEIKTPSSSFCKLGIQIETANWEISIKMVPGEDTLEYLTEAFVKS